KKPRASPNTFGSNTTTPSIPVGVACIGAIVRHRPGGAGAGALPASSPRSAAYNRGMFEAMKALAERSVMERVVLLLNHVVAAEPQAMERLRGHAGRTLRIELEGWPSILPAPAPIGLRVTPPGLVGLPESPRA